MKPFTEWGWVKLITLFSEKPVWNNSSELDHIWEPFAKESTEVLGTIAEARKTLDDCRHTFSKEQLGHKLGYIENDVNRLTQHSPDYVLGHTNRVSYLFDGRISLGYVIKRHPSGHVLECLEGLGSRLVVLRFHGYIIAAYSCSMCRHEIRGGMEVF